MKKELFVLTELRTGGREKIVSQLAKFRKATLFSVWKTIPTFDVGIPVYFGVDDFSTTFEPRTNSKNGNAGLSHLKNFVVKILKISLNYSFIQRERIKKLNELIKTGGYDRVVLSDLTITFARAIKRENPEVEIIGWIHNSYDMWWNQQYMDYKRELSQNFDFVKKFVILSPSYEKDFRTIISSDKLVYIPNPYPEFSRRNNTFDSRYLLNVSRMDVSTKGIDQLISFADLLPDPFILKIIGPANGVQEKEYNDLVQKMIHPHKIKWLGELTGDNLVEQYEHAFGYVIMSRFEGFPVTLGEAMAKGLPILGYSIAAVKTVLSTTQLDFGVVEYGNVTELLKKFKTLMNRDVYSKAVHASESQVEVFSFQSVSAKWEEL